MFPPFVLFCCFPFCDYIITYRPLQYPCKKAIISKKFFCSKNFSARTKKAPASSANAVLYERICFLGQPTGLTPAHRIHSFQFYLYHNSIILSVKCGARRPGSFFNYGSHFLWSESSPERIQIQCPVYQFCTAHIIFSSLYRVY